MASSFVRVDTKDLTKGIKDVEKYGMAIRRGITLGMKELSMRLEAKLIENMVMYGLGGSDLMNKIVVDIGTKGISINVASEYALYIEFGTGIVGTWNPHPHPWLYDVNNHGYTGWFYPTTESDPNPYKYMKNGQLYGWTRGQASRPFMYKTWLWGRRSATQIIKKNIRAEVKKSMKG